MHHQTIHSRVLVQNYQASLHFYRDLLGFEVNWDDGNYASFQAGEIRLAIFKREMMAEAVGRSEIALNAESQDKFALIIEVSNVDEYYRKLKEKGVHFVKLPQDYPDWGIRAAHFRDPDGNLIEINSGLDRST